MKQQTKKVWSMDINLVRTEESAGTIIQKCSVKNMFFEILQNSQENTCAGVSPNELWILVGHNFIEKW